MSKKIKLSRGKYAIVDDDDYKYLKKFNWHLGKSGHPTLSRGIYMVSLIKPKGRGLRYLFKNRNPLDLRKENIDIVGWGVVSGFAKKTKSKTSSKYKGVYWDKRAKKWCAYLTIRKGKKRIKVLWEFFDDENKAAIARNKKALEVFGENAYQNVIK